MASVYLSGNLLYYDKNCTISVDFNVPMNDGTVVDATRIVACLPTIELALKKGAKSIILASHLGRPKGKPNEKYSLRPVHTKLLEYLPQCKFVNDCVGIEVERVIKENDHAVGEIFLLENLRFHPEEECEDAEATLDFRNALSRLGDVYVNDAFGTLHRAHSSIVGFQNHPRVVGLLVEKELECLGDIVKHGLDVLVLGGAKVSDKMGLIESLLPRVKHVVIGGGMAYTFLKQQGTKVGSSLVDDSIDTRKIIERARQLKVSMHLPLDHVISDKDGHIKTCNVDIPDDWTAYDIGPATIDCFTKVIKENGRVFWNGPMGMFEKDEFASGTVEVLKAMAFVSENSGIAIIGINLCIY